MRSKVFNYKLIVILSIIFMLILFIKSYFGCKVTEDYGFDCGYDIDGKSVSSTDYIDFPSFIRQEAKYTCINRTGYKICIFDSVNGFVEFEQGSMVLSGRPLLFFVAKPANIMEGNKFSGEFSIQECGGNATATYYIEENYENKILCDYKLKL